jgi:hypothetical protein
MTRYVALTVVLFALLASPARGAGGPVVGGDAGAAGVTAPGLGTRYLTQRVPGGTLVMAVDRSSGAILQSRFLHEHLVVSAAAYDGSATGLAADGGTLVLAAPRRSFPQRRSDFVVVETARLHRVARFSLHGDFSLDAISPDGGLLYFVQSFSATRYAVRAFDLTAERLRRAPVVDPAEPDEPLRGSPMARALSRDGRWAYTLYDGNGKHPFIHALDTERARAKCIDLDGLAGRQDMIDMRLTVGGGGTVLVRDGSRRPLYAVDPRTFAVHVPRPAAPAPPAPVADDGNPGWIAPVAGLALLALLALVAVKAGGGRFAPARTRQ